MSIMEIKDLTKKYSAFTLDGVSFSLKEGAITGFIGRNGAGKSTTLKSALGFVHPDSGDVKFFGLDYSENQREIKQRIGFVAGGFGFYASKKLKAITDVTKAFYDKWDENAYNEYMTKFNLDQNKTPSQLSEGMKVKYALTLALSHHAELLILDEPTSGLDPISRDELLDILIELNKKGTTIFFSTHITSDLEKCADNIVYIRQGKVAASSDINEFTESYRFVSLTDEEYEQADKALLIGCKAAKNGYSAIISAADENKLKVKTEKADLENIMIHLEKE